MHEEWWRGAVAYQVWPASFKDSNEDGLGDILGIVDKLDYLKDLGIDLLWLSPVNDSPQMDMGYDISDYEAIYPPYGSLDDMDNLIRQAKERSIRIVMDLVVNHTSHKHRWFLESCKSRDNPYSDWYIWRDPKLDGEGTRHPPSNWRTGSRHGRSCWTYVASRDQYYFNFGAFYQPNLNWANAETRKGIFESAIRFWLDRGIHGFRMDLCGFYWKHPSFPDADIVYPGEEMQPLDGRYCQNGRPVHQWLKELRRLVGLHFGKDIVLIGELPGTDKEEFLEFISPESNELHMALDTDIFITGNRWIDDLGDLKRPELPAVKDAVVKTQSMLDRGAWPTVFLENHDFARSVSRFGPGDGIYRESAAKMLALLASTLSGTLFIYQGQEIGMTNVPSGWTKNNFRDHMDLSRTANTTADNAFNARDKSIEALVQWGRDNGRTPVQWSREAFAGFSKRQPWICVNDNYPRINVAAQSADPDSILSFWKQMVRLRKEKCDLLMHGDFHLLDRDDTRTFSYMKTSVHVKQKYMIILNFSDTETDLDPGSSHLPITSWHVVISTAGRPQSRNQTRLSPWEGRLYQAIREDLVEDYIY